MRNNNIPRKKWLAQGILSFLLFLGTFYCKKCQEVYPLKVYYPDDPTRLCRPKAGQSLVTTKVLSSVNKVKSCYDDI